MRLKHARCVAIHLDLDQMLHSVASGQGLHFCLDLTELFG